MQPVNQALRRITPNMVYSAGVFLALVLLAMGLTGLSGPDPVSSLERDLGEWALRVLILSLAITPLARLAGVRMFHLRRSIALVGFGLASLHLLTWAGLDLGLRWSQILNDLTRRPYIIIGMVAILAMLPLAITSNDSLLRRMGGAAWRKLHRLAYPAVLLAAVHGVMIPKLWEVKPLFYLSLVIVLLAVRFMPRPAKQS